MNYGVLIVELVKNNTIISFDEYEENNDTNNDNVNDNDNDKYSILVLAKKTK